MLFIVVTVISSGNRTDMGVRAIPDRKYSLTTVLAVVSVGIRLSTGPISNSAMDRNVEATGTHLHLQNPSCRMTLLA